MILECKFVFFCFMNSYNSWPLFKAIPNDLLQLMTSIDKYWALKRIHDSSWLFLIYQDNKDDQDENNHEKDNKTKKTQKKSLN